MLGVGQMSWPPPPNRDVHVVAHPWLVAAAVATPSTAFCAGVLWAFTGGHPSWPAFFGVLALIGGGLMVALGGALAYTKRRAGR